MSVNIIDKAGAKLAEAYAGPGGIVAGDLLNTLIQMAMDLIGQCFSGGGTPQSLIQDARERNRRAVVLADRVVRRELRSRYGLFGFARHNGQQMVEALLKAGAESKPEEIQELSSLS